MASDEGWQPPEAAPKDGNVFMITTAGPGMDLCWYDKKSGEFRDYYFKQRIAPTWPYMVAWRKMPKPADPCNTEEECRRANGWPEKEKAASC